MPLPPLYLKDQLGKAVQSERPVVEIDNPGLVRFARSKPLPFDVVLRS